MAFDVYMREMLTLLREEARDLLLLASLLTAGPAWVGGVEFLSALGLDGGAAAFLSGTYAGARGLLSAGLLVSHARHGTLSFGGDWLTRALETVGDHALVATAYPIPEVGAFSTPTHVQAC